MNSVNYENTKIQSECGKIRTSKTPNTADTFHTVYKICPNSDKNSTILDKTYGDFFTF